MVKMINVCIFFFFGCPAQLWDFSSWTMDWTQAMAVKPPNPNHWNTREFLVMCILTQLKIQLGSSLHILFSLWRLSVSLLRFHIISFVSCVSVIACNCLNIFMMVALKFLSGNFKLSVISGLVSTPCLFSFGSWFLVWWVILNRNFDFVGIRGTS